MRLNELNEYKKISGFFYDQTNIDCWFVIKYIVSLILLRYLIIVKFLCLLYLPRCLKIYFNNSKNLEFDIVECKNTYKELFD